jgi:hypothetical protein
LVEDLGRERLNWEELARGEEKLGIVVFLGGSGLGLVQKVRLCVYCSGLERGGRKEGGGVRKKFGDFGR